MQKAIGLLFILFGVLEFAGLPRFPDTMQAFVLVSPPAPIAWAYFPIGALLCVVLGGVVLCTRKVGLYGVMLLAVAYVALHASALFNLPGLEYGLFDAASNVDWFDTRALGSFAVWFAVAAGVAWVAMGSEGDSNAESSS